MKKILITGANGFIGKHLINEVEGSIISIGLESSTIISKNDHFEYYQADVCNPEKMNALLKGVDVCVNLAAVISQEEAMEEVNVNGVKNLVQACLKQGVSTFIQLSSVGVFGVGCNHKATRVIEDYKCMPQNTYEKTKYKAERYIIETLEDSDMDYAILRPTNVFGPQHPWDQLLKMCNFINKNHYILFGRKAKVNYLYVKDLVKVINFFISNEAKERVFNIGSSMDFEQFVDMVSTALQTRVRKIRVADSLYSPILLVSGLLGNRGRNYVQSLFNQTIYDDSRLKLLTSLEYDTEAGIMETVQYFRKEGKLS